MKNKNNLQLILLFLCNLHLIWEVNALKHYNKQRKLELREKVRGMFQHAYDGYLRYASDYDELRPLTCDGQNTWGSYSLTLIDALDTLAIMGNYSEFRRVATLLETSINFDKDINVSVFETNIRIVGGLLSAHLLSKRAGLQLEKGWPCNGPLLRLAEDVAKRLLPAFNTATGMPYGTVNLRYGVPKGETSVTCTAGVTTFFVEFGTLSRLTGNPIYEEVALNAVYAMWERRSQLGLFGNHIDVLSGRWTALDAGIGAGVDSFFEYLVKGAILLNRPDLLELFHTARHMIDMYMKRDDWYVWVNMNKGQVTLPVFQSLEAFWPGILALLGDIGPAMRTMARYSTVWKKYGFLPEFYNILTMECPLNRESYPLRPELIESAMYLYRATNNEFLLELGEQVIESIEFSAKTKCGYSTIRNVITHEKENRMESFFLSETTKYLYLLFDEDNFIHNDGGSGEKLDTPHGQCFIHTGPYIFNTEAHPIDYSALYCCHDLRENIYENLDLEMFNAEHLLKAERDKWVLREEQSTKYSCDGDSSENTIFEGSATHQTLRSAIVNASRFSESVKEPTLAVDIEVFDEDNNPAGDALVESFELLKSELNQERITKTRDHLTVEDITEFFNVKRKDFEDNEFVVVHIINFMRNFTLDPAMIAGLELFDKNISLVLGTVVQKDYESRVRTLWELYRLKQAATANVGLVAALGLRAFQVEENSNLLNDILKALDESPMLNNQSNTTTTSTSPTTTPTTNFNSINDTNNKRNADENYRAILTKLYKATKWYEHSLVNTTAMQEFLLKILINGTNSLKKKRYSFQPLLSREEIESINVNALNALSENYIAIPKTYGQLFSHVRRIVEFKKRMMETFEKLQNLMQENGKFSLTGDKKISEDNSENITAEGTSDLKTSDGVNGDVNKNSDNDNTTVNQNSDTSSNENAEMFGNVSEHQSSGNDSENPKDETAEADDNVNSVWAQLVQTILRKTTMQPEKFDAEQLLAKTRKSLKNYTKIPQNYGLFTCQRAKFINKFAYREFHP